MIGCDSHRFNVAVKKYLQESGSSILCENVNTPMRKPSSLKKAARLRSKTELMSIQKNNTRWNSTHVMLKRYLELRDHIDESDADLACFLPSAADALKLKSLMESLSEFEFVSLHLQQDDVTKCASWALFHALLQNIPIT